MSPKIPHDQSLEVYNSLSKEDCKIGKKRGLSDKNDKATKKLCRGIDNVEDPKFSSGSNKSRQDKTEQYSSPYPHQLIGLMYQLDLSVLCLHRKHTYDHKYPSLSVTFGDSEINKFSSIVFHNEEKSIYVQIENVDKYYADNSINYPRLFSKEKRSIFFINDYFDSFAKYLLSESDNLLNNVEYLVIYTNSRLDLTEEKELKKGRFKNFYPFKFVSVNMEKSEVLRDFLCTNDATQGSGFYQFSKDKTKRIELLKRLDLSSAVQKLLKERKISSEKIKEAFLEKLVFAVNQPNREELSSIVRNKMKRKSQVQYRKQIHSDLLAAEKLKNYTSKIMYGFNLLLLLLHDMFILKNILSVNLAGKSCDDSNDIAIGYKDGVVFVKALSADNINYSQLFPSKKLEKKSTFCINKLFSQFIQEFQSDMRYFIIFTHAGLDLTEKNELKKVLAKSFYPLKFNSLDKSKCDIFLKDFLFSEECSFYQFSQDETTRAELFKRLECSSAVQKVIKERNLSLEELKESFLNKLVFLIDQPGVEELSSLAQSSLKKNNEVAYNYEELYETALRWLESHELGAITKKMIKNISKDVKNNISSYQKIQKNIDEEIKFARSVVGREGTPSFYQFLNFVTKGQGSFYIEVLKRNAVNLSNVSGILHGAGDESVRAFRELYDFWFDKDGNEMQCLQALKQEGVNLANISSILHGARACAAKAFEDLYELWFDQDGNKTRCLTKLSENGVNLVNVSSILSGAGAYACQAFRDLYELWFHDNGKRTKYLKKLKKNGVNLVHMSSILSGAGANASRAFKDLYGLWFDELGNKQKCLSTLEAEGISLANVSSVLHRAGSSAAPAFENLYSLWFDENGEKTRYLTTLAENEVDLVRVSSILSGAGANAPRAFKELYGLWFDQNDNKTQYLTNLEKNGVDLVRMSSILSGAGVNASRAFRDLYDIWFDEAGNKKQCLQALEDEGVGLASVSSVLHRAGSGASQAFRDLYNLWFDRRGKKTHYLKTLETEGINLTTLTTILHGAGNSAAQALKSLYDIWFDEKGKCLKVLEENEVDLASMSTMLGSAGANAPRAFKELFDNFFDDQGAKKPHLRHFTKKKEGKKNFTMLNLSSILSGAGANTSKAFEELHDVCFSDRGKKTKLLKDFYNEGFKPSNLSCLLCKTGVQASSVLKRLHGVCFDENRAATEYLTDFYNAGFKLKYLCSLLSGAADSLEKFHNFCFVKKSKRFLERFLREGFTPKNLSNVLHGSRANICTALKSFHDVCFDVNGERSELLDDFLNAGFTPSNLSSILTMSGSNAASIFGNFHKSCFGKKNYLSHFLAEKKIFTPQNLSKMLFGAGTKTHSKFKKLHDLCFDKSGNRTKYLNDLIENVSDLNEIVNILHKNS